VEERSWISDIALEEGFERIISHVSVDKGTDTVQKWAK
jgi:hypothetical protein